jgi:hypothetical protein
MVNLVFTGVAGKDPDIRIAEDGNTIAIFPVDVTHRQLLRRSS